MRFRHTIQVNISLLELEKCVISHPPACLLQTVVALSNFQIQKRRYPSKNHRVFQLKEMYSTIYTTTTATAAIIANLRIKFQLNFVSLQFRGIRTGFRVQTIKYIFKDFSKIFNIELKYLNSKFTPNATKLRFKISNNVLKYLNSKLSPNATKLRF